MRIRIQGSKLLRIHADPDLGRTLNSQKAELLQENLLKVGDGSKNNLCSWIRIPNTDPDRQYYIYFLQTEKSGGVVEKRRSAARECVAQPEW